MMRASKTSGSSNRAKWNSAYSLIEHFFHKCICPLSRRHGLLKVETRIDLRGSILVILLLLQMGLALPIHASPNPVTFSLSPEVEKAIKTADPKTAARMKRAIKVGNRFIRLRFNNDDGYDLEIDDEWNKTVGPLLSMSGKQWFEWRDQRLPASLPIRLPGSLMQSTSLMACPAVTLLEIKSANDNIALTYRATLAAGYVQIYPDTPGKGGHRNWIDKTLSGRPYNLVIEIGPNNRIVRELASEKSLVFNYLYFRDSFLRSAEADEANGKKLQRQDILNDAKQQRQLIADIDSATSICKSSSIKLNQ